LEFITVLEPQIAINQYKGWLITVIGLDGNGCRLRGYAGSGQQQAGSRPAVIAPRILVIP
jgi:hypothetical protein